MRYNTRHLRKSGGQVYVELTIYLDVMWLRTFFVELNVCLFVSLWLRLDTPVGRVLWMCAAAASAEVACFVLAGYGVWYACGSVLLRLIFTECLYRVRSVRRFVRIVLWSLFATVFAGGILGCVEQHLPRSCWFGAGCCICAVTILAALILEERRRQQDVRLYRVRLRAGERELSLVGLHDTGNRLRDPYVHLPVHILPRSELERLLPERGAGRLIPFSTVGVSDGLMEVWTIDAMEWENGACVPAVIGAADDALFKGKDYRLILSAEWENQTEGFGGDQHVHKDQCTELFSAKDDTDTVYHAVL